MTPEIKQAVALRVKEITGCTKRDSNSIAMMLEAKVCLEQKDNIGAVEKLLELIIRLYAIEGIGSPDELTKLLNSDFNNTNIRTSIMDDSGYV